MIADSITSDGGQRMKTKLILLFLAAALLASPSTCSSEAPQELSVDISYSGKKVALANGGTLTVTLESNPSTGYSWNENAKIIDETVESKQTTDFSQC
jgi:hypothetical protein